jgi:hypothetical protein
VFRGFEAEENPTTGIADCRAGAVNGHTLEVASHALRAPVKFRKANRHKMIFGSVQRAQVSLPP